MTVVASRTAVEHRSWLSGARVAHETFGAGRAGVLVIATVLTERADGEFA